MRSPNEQERFLTEGRFVRDTPAPKPAPRNVFLMAFGIALFVSSFFLAGVSKDGDPIPGYLCAQMSLMTPVFFLSGLINPLLLVYLSLLAVAKPRIRKFRCGIAVTILVLLAGTTIELVAYKFGLQIGFFIWAAGLMMIAHPELVNAVR